MSTLGQYRIFKALLEERGLPVPRREWEFHWERQWKVDYCWPDPEHMLALEVEGGAWTYGRHNRASGFVKDMEKYNALACCGYRLVRVQPKNLCTDATIDLVRRALLSR